MNKSNIIYAVVFAIMASAMMTSCSKENIDEENLIPEEIEVITEITYQCDSLYVYSSEIRLSTIGQANLFRLDGNCINDGSSFPLNYQILDSDWDSGAGTPSIYHALDGIPGFSFGLELDTEVGDIVTIQKSHLGTPSLFKLDTSDDFYELADDCELILSDFGTTIGEYIGGELSGKFVNSTTNETHDFFAGFCVPITYICE